MVEEVLHIAVNTPQIYEVPKSQRSRLLAILQSYLQKRVMQFLQGCSDDPEELSHRQLEANRFRSIVMKQVYQLLREEQEREMSMSSTVMNGFEYYFKENANPFNDMIEKRWHVDETEEIEVTPIRDEFEAKRKRINDEYLDSLLHPSLKIEAERDDEKDEEIGKVMLYTNLKDLISVDDPSVRRYPDEVGVDITGDAEFSMMLKEMKDENELLKEMNKQMDEIEGVGKGMNEWNGREKEKEDESDDDDNNRSLDVKREEEEKKMERKGMKEIVENGEGKEANPMAFSKNRIEGESNDSNESNDLKVSNESKRRVELNALNESNDLIPPGHSHESTEAKEIPSTASPPLIESTSPVPLSPIPKEVKEDKYLLEVSKNGDIALKTRATKPETKPSEQEEHIKTILEASAEQLQQIRKDLSQKYRHFSSQNAFVSENIIMDIVEILHIFGIPYVFAPGEAEAQCAFLDLMELVDGVISNDSDVFAFGGKTMYRNFFVDNRFVEVYKIEDIEKERGLNRNRIIELALLLGCDYCEVGICFSNI